MNAPNQLAEMKSPAPREASMPAVAPGFGSLQSYELMMRQAKMLSASTLVPVQYRQIVEKKKGRDVTWEQNDNAVPNCVIAMNMAQRMNADPLMVMQNLHIVEGRPSWSSIWIIAAINTCGRFAPLRYEMFDFGEQEVEYAVTEWENGPNGSQKKTAKVKTTVRNRECIAWTVEKGVELPRFSLEDLRKYKSVYGCCKECGIPLVESPPVNIEMAVKEGWYQKNGSKWQTMPEVMLRYRTASFFGKLYAPELLMGLPSTEELQDTFDATRAPDGSFSVDVSALKESAAPATRVDTSTGEILDAQPAATFDQDDGDLRQVEQSGRQPAATGDGPTFEDATAAVKAGDYDLARDMARGFPEGQRQALEQAIANTQQPQQTRQRRERGQGGLGIE